MAILPFSHVIRQIVDDCRLSDVPEACLQGHLDRLAKEADWTAADVLEVQTKARRILASVLYRPPTG
jgi:hypothetical protein